MRGLLRPLTFGVWRLFRSAGQGVPYEITPPAGAVGYLRVHAGGYVRTGDGARLLYRAGG